MSGTTEVPIHSPGPGEQGSNEDDDDDVVVESNGATGKGIDIIDLSDQESLSEVPLEAEKRPRPRRSARRVCYEEDSDEDEVQKEKTKKIIQSSCMEIEYLRLGPLKIPPKVNHLTFMDQDFDGHNFNTLFNNYGHQIESLSFETMSLEMIEKIASACPKLKILTLRELCAENKGMAGPISGASFTFKKLNKLSVPGNSEFMKTEKNFDILFSSMPRTLEILHYTFTTLEDVDKMLGRVESSKNLHNLKSLVIEHTKRNSDGEEVILRRKQLNLIARLELKNLESLELNCGIWEDVRGRDLEALLSQFSPTLEHFTIAGNVSGRDMADKTLKFTVLKMPRLLSLSMGVVYEFEDEVDPEEEGAPGRSSHASAHPPLISLDKTELISIEVDIPATPTLESLSLGNLVNIREIDPKRFPGLRRLHIGSSWMMTLDLTPLIPAGPPQFPVFPLVRELQFPDCFQDEFFMEKIPEMFPVLRKVTMKLPSVRCLRRFFNVMSNSRLSALHVMTSYDFDGMLETAICANPVRPEKKGQPSLASRPFSDERFVELKKLENAYGGDKVFLTFVKSKGIELPIPTIDPILNTPYGIGDLKELKSLVIGHVPRTIRIPLKNTLAHDHPQQKYHSFLKIGFREYPLSKRFFKEDLKQLRNLTDFRAAPNIRVSSKYKMWNLVSYEGQSGCRYRQRNPHHVEGSDEEELEGMLYQEVAGMSNGDITGPTTGNRKRKLKVNRQNANLQGFKVKKEEPGDVKMEFKTEPIKKEFKVKVE